MQQSTAQSQSIGNLYGSRFDLHRNGFFRSAALEGSLQRVECGEVYLGHAQRAKQQVFSFLDTVGQSIVYQLLHQGCQRRDHGRAYRSFEDGGIGLARADSGATKGHQSALRCVFGDDEVASRIAFDADFSRIELAIAILVDEHGGIGEVTIDRHTFDLTLVEGIDQPGQCSHSGIVVVLIWTDAVEPFAGRRGDGGASEVAVAPSGLQLQREGFGCINTLVQRGGVFALGAVGQGEGQRAGGGGAAVELLDPVLAAHGLGGAAQYVQVDGVDQLGTGAGTVQFLRFSGAGKAFGDAAPVALGGNGLPDPVVQASRVGRAAKVSHVDFLHGIDPVGLHFVDECGEVVGGSGRCGRVGDVGPGSTSFCSWACTLVSSSQGFAVECGRESLGCIELGVANCSVFALGTLHDGQGSVTGLDLAFAELFHPVSQPHIFRSALEQVLVDVGDQLGVVLSCVQGLVLGRLRKGVGNLTQVSDALPMGQALGVGRPTEIRKVNFLDITGGEGHGEGSWKQAGKPQAAWGRPGRLIFDVIHRQSIVSKVF